MRLKGANQFVGCAKGFSGLSWKEFSLIKRIDGIKDLNQDSWSCF